MLTNPQRGSLSQLAYKQSDHSAAQDGALMWDAATGQPVVSKGGAFVTVPTAEALLATGTLGYATGAGGTVTQITSKATAVTLDKRAGVITTHNAALAAGASVEFDVNNSIVEAPDVPMLAVASPAGRYTAAVIAVAAGSFRVRLTNITALSRSDAVALNFVVLKGASA